MGRAISIAGLRQLPRIARLITSSPCASVKAGRVRRIYKNDLGGHGGKQQCLQLNSTIFANASTSFSSAGSGCYLLGEQIDLTNLGHGGGARERVEKKLMKHLTMFGVGNANTKLIEYPRVYSAADSA